MQRARTDGRRIIIRVFISVIIALALVLVDRFTKNYFADYFNGSFDYASKKEIIPDFFFFTLKANTGAAWSFLSDVDWAQTFFKILTSVAFIALIFVYVYAVRNNSRWLQITVAVMFAGAIGNFIDRLAYGYVIDFIGFKFGNYIFPIFNVADICLTVGTCMFIVYLLFMDKNAIFKKNGKVKNSDNNSISG